MSARIPLIVQIGCVEREIAKRLAVYPRLVEAHKLSQHKADHEIEAMREVLASLHQLAKLEGVTIPAQADLIPEAKHRHQVAPAGEDPNF